MGKTANRGCALSSSHGFTPGKHRPVLPQSRVGAEGTRNFLIAIARRGTGKVQSPGNDGAILFDCGKGMPRGDNFLKTLVDGFSAPTVVAIPPGFDGPIGTKGGEGTLVGDNVDVVVAGRCLVVGVVVMAPGDDAPVAM